MYITFFRKTHLAQQLTFEDLYENFGTTEQQPVETVTDSFPRKLTIWNPNFNVTNQPITRMQNALIQIEPRVHDMLNLLQLGEEAQYETFYIPKHSGGLRRIDAPKLELMTLLRDIKNIFDNDLHFLAHDRAFAYVKHRSTKEALQEHQKNNSKWFLKLDMQDFFPSCTYARIMAAMSKTFPFATLLGDTRCEEILQKIAKICLLNGKLPQGTPMSPILTNLIMVGYDFRLYKKLNDFDRQRFIYTRYADDLLISSQFAFDKEKVLKEVQGIIQPFQLNLAKTRYGSSAGRNWNLGLMLNKDNQITIGYKRKQRVKAAIFNFLQDFTNGTRWSTIDTQVLLGLMSYYQKIEPEYIEYITTKYSEKFNVEFKQCIKAILR